MHKHPTPEKSSRPACGALERELAESRRETAALKAERDFLKTLLETIPTPIFHKDTDGVYTGCNRAFEALTGKRREEIIGRTVDDMGAPAVVKKYRDQDTALLKTMRPQSYRWKLPQGDGEPMDVIIDKAPLLDQTGKVSGLVGVITDITPHVETEKALRESEERYRALADASFEAVFIGKNGICIDANDTASRMFGYSREEMIGMFGTKIIAPESMEIVKKNMLSRYEEPYEAVCRRKDGSTFAVEICGKMAEYKGEIARITVVHDIDGYVRATAALKESEKNLHYLSSSLMAAQERERQWLAYTMHEKMAQDLVVLTIELKHMESMVRDDPSPLRQACRDVKKHVVGILENIRAISNQLSPVMISDLGLSAAIRLLIEDFTQRTGIAVAIDMANIDKLFPLKTEIVVYRIFQEAFTNIRKHSRAAHVQAVVRKQPDGLHISIEDDGIGFVVEDAETGKGAEKKLGFLAMEERARMLGAVLNRRSSPGRDTRIVFQVPIAGA